MQHILDHLRVLVRAVVGWDDVLSVCTLHMRTPTWHNPITRCTPRQSLEHSSVLSAISELTLVRLVDARLL
jgi:hypothetical protein